MKISTRGEYGVRAMLELGLNEGDELSLRELGSRWHVSQEYLEQIMPLLREAGLVCSRRGAHGGYRLGRPADQITVAEIVETLEGRCKLTDCLTDSNSCFAARSCAIQDVWDDVSVAVHDALSRYTLADLVRKQKGYSLCNSKSRLMARP
jgi:Rrf2 family transcriptional regulator, cysteine metabolism repressor